MNRWHSLPAEIYSLVEHTPATVLLESAPTPSGCVSGGAPDATKSTVSRLFTAPVRVCAAYDPAELPALFAELESAVSRGQFAAGHFAYECGAFFEPTAASKFNSSDAPIAWIGIYDHAFVFDHHAGAFVEGGPPDLPQFLVADERTAYLETNLAITEGEYAERIAAIQEKIREGDIYQLNFTVPLTVRAQGSFAALYQALRSGQPAPYGAFVHTQPGHRILSFSPELFFHIDQAGPGRRVTTRPMKGTAPRGRTAAEDRAFSEWLRNDAKNRAENVMIVDLLRNDLGRVAGFGTVRTQDLFAVERYPTLWQMTSTITAELRADVGFQEIFRALFPCGSITGAPKVRAMQLISEFEQQPRGVYTGAIGFFSSAEAVFSVAIRTVELHGDSGSMGVGSGIVIDSDPAAEFRECLLKAKFLTAAFPAPRSNVASPSMSESSAGDFSLVETMLWNDEKPEHGFPLLQLHLERLDDSASYFAFPFDRAAVLSALDAEARTFDARPRKVRLLLGSDGNIQLTSELLPAPMTRPLRIRIAAQRTDPADAMYFHKTTHRQLYAEAFEAAAEAGYADVLFLNLRDEVTEGAIHNIFVEKNGCLITPPVDCGLLAGVYRRHIMEARRASESVLRLADLREADGVYLSNAVRGLRRAHIDWE